MATFHALEVRQETLSGEVTQQVSKYSESLRNRLGQIADFKDTFYKAFDGFVENDLPRDKLYMEMATKAGINDKLPPEEKKEPPPEEQKKQEDRCFSRPFGKDEEKIFKKYAHVAVNRISHGLFLAPAREVGPKEKF